MNDEMNENQFIARFDFKLVLVEIISNQRQTFRLSDERYAIVIIKLILF